MASLNLTEAGGALKKFYLPTVRNQINNKCLLLQQISADDEHVEGDEWILSLQVKRNSGVGWRGENDTSPTAGSQKYVQARDSVKELRGRIEITQRVISAMASNKGSFVRAVDSEMKGVGKDAARNQNRAFIGTSNGVIATCGTTSASTTVTLATATPKSALRQLEQGMVIDIGTVANPVLRAQAREITSVDTAAKTMVITGAAITTASTDFIFISGSGGTSPQLEPTGLQTIVDSAGVVHNVDPATYQLWASFEEAQSSGPVNDSKLENAMDEVDLRSGEEVNLLLASYGVYREYGNYLTVMKRAQNTLDLKGGYKALSISSGSRAVGLARERDVPDGMVFGLNTDHLFAPTMADWQFMDDDGAVLSRVANKNAYEATAYKFVDLATDQRNAHFKLTGFYE
jgi:hypothetical protein